MSEIVELIGKEAEEAAAAFEARIAKMREVLKKSGAKTNEGVVVRKDGSFTGIKEDD